jgi:N-acetylglucosamine-6-sulfatase
VATALVLVVVLVLLGAGSGWAGSGGQSGAGADRGEANRRPNIVFVLADDFSWDLVRYMPRLRAMQRRGTTFTRHFVPNSLCCPSRAALFTGAFPHNNGIYENAGEDGGFLGFRSHGLEKYTFATALKSGGFRTALMGKYLNSYRTASGYVPPGWTDWVGSDRVYGGFGYDLNEDGDISYHGFGTEDYVTDVLARKGAGFIDDASGGDSPFFLELATYAPHKPYTPAPRHLQMFRGLRAPRGPSFDQANVNPPQWLRRRPRNAWEKAEIDVAFRDRVRSVQAVDEMLGRVQATLRDRGLDDDTYVVFSSDNGYHMGQHRLMPGKMTAFDSDIRVPLIVTGPGVPAGRVIERITQSIDLNPTFAELGGVRPSAMSDGRSLVRLLHGKPVARWRRAALIEHRGPDMRPDDPDLPPPNAGDPPPSYEAVRTPYALYVEYRNGEREFYDLKRDPAQIDNRYWGLRPHRRARLERTLNRLRACLGPASCWAAASDG